jgi:hypothetical protein
LRARVLAQSWCSTQRNTACNGVTRALVRSTKTPSKRASSANLPGSIAKAGPG